MVKEFVESGREVGSKAIQSMMDGLKRMGKDDVLLLADTGITPKELKKKNARFGWSQMVQIFKNLRLQYHLTNDEIIEVGALAIESPALKFYGRLAMLLFSLEELYEMTNGDRTGTPGAEIISCIKLTTTRDTSRNFITVLEMKPGYELPEEFVMTTLGTIKAVPRIYGMKDLDITYRISDKRGVFRYACPQRGGFLAPLRRFVMSLFLGRKQFENLNNAYTMMQKQNLELNSQIIELRKTKNLLAQANREKSDFVARVSHEIRTPLNGIMGMTDILSQSTLSEDDRECLSSIQSASEHLLQLINNVLTFSKLDAGKRELESVPIHILEELKGVASVYEVNNKENVIFTTDFSGITESTTLIGDATAVRQILFNLINNAMKFTKVGEVHLEAHCNDNLKFTVSDTGIGIAPEKIDEVFRPFVQEDTSKTREYGGTGLGLSVVKTLVDMMKGTLSIESHQEKGTAITVKLPLQLGETAESETGSKEEVISGESYKILVVDDNPINRKVLGRFLLDLGHKVSYAEDGVQAIEKVESELYDTIFMDIMMPNLSGDEATKLIRQMSSYKETPIIAVTADVFDSDIQSYLECGMNGVITKPFRRSDLQNALVTFMS